MSMNTHVQSHSTIRVQLQSLHRRCGVTVTLRHREAAPRKSKASHLAPTSESNFFTSDLHCSNGARLLGGWGGGGAVFSKLLNLHVTKSAESKRK